MNSSKIQPGHSEAAEQEQLDGGSENNMSQDEPKKLLEESVQNGKKERDTHSFDENYGSCTDVQQQLDRETVKPEESPGQLSTVKKKFRCAKERQTSPELTSEPANEKNDQLLLQNREQSDLLLETLSNPIENELISISKQEDKCNQSSEVKKAIVQKPLQQNSSTSQDEMRADSSASPAQKFEVPMIAEPQIEDNQHSSEEPGKCNMRPPKLTSDSEKCLSGTKNLLKPVQVGCK